MLQLITGQGSKAFQHILGPMSLQTPGLVIILMIFFFVMRFGVLNIVLGVIVSQSPATRAILTQLKGGDTEHQADKLPKTL